MGRWVGGRSEGRCRKQRNCIGMSAGGLMLMWTWVGGALQIIRWWQNITPPNINIVGLPAGSVFVDENGHIGRQKRWKEGKLVKNNSFFLWFVVPLRIHSIDDRLNTWQFATMRNSTLDYKQKYPTLQERKKKIKQTSRMWSEMRSCSSSLFPLSLSLRCPSSPLLSSPPSLCAHFASILSA